MNKSNEQRRLHARVTGRVQGVGFRYYIHDSVKGLNIAGFVRNRWDGSVEVLAEGSESDLRTLETTLRRGPRASFVSNVECSWGEPTGEYSGFTIQRTN